MQENLLTQEEIESVLTEAKKVDWLNPNLIGLNSKRASIFRLSLAIKGLILINGDEHTGMMHIQQRHQFGRQVWRDDKEELEVTSEFRYGVSSYDYLTIAESVYTPDNLRPDLNKRSDKFDLYLGDYVHKNGDAIAYILLTYRGTGIIHTLYPLKSDNQRKKLPKYKRCHIGWSYDVMHGLHTYSIPYKNKSGSEVFKIIIIGIERYPIVRHYIQIGEGNTMGMTKQTG